MRFSDLTYLEIAESARDGALVVLPTGCTEQQGPHLPVDTDTWLAEAILNGAAERLEDGTGQQILVLPALPFGPTPEHRNFGSGYIDLPQPLHEAVVEVVLDSLASQGFRRIVIWRGCGQHELRNVASCFNVMHRGECKVFQPDMPYRDIWCRIGDEQVPGGHADSFVTSLALYLRPDSVRVHLIENPQNEPVDWTDSELDFSRYSRTGVIGDPTQASAELGARLWAGTVAEVAAILREIAEAAV